MKALIAAALMVSFTASAQSPEIAQLSKSVDKYIATCEKNVQSAGHQTLLAQQALFRQFPEVKACEAKGWPDTDACNNVARAITKAMLINLDGPK